MDQAERAEFEREAFERLVGTLTLRQRLLILAAVVMLAATFTERPYTRAVEELLSEREALSTLLHEGVAARAQEYGVTVHRVGVKDIILPGSVQRVFLQEVEADRAGRAALVAARHETAAARARANTAKMMRDNPTIMRLQELEALLTLASKAGNLLIVPGLDSLLTRDKGEEKD